MLHRLLCQAHPRNVDFGNLPTQPVTREPEAVGAKGVGLDNLRSGLQVLLVDRKDQAGVGKVQLVVAAVDEDTTAVEHGSHGAIGKYRTAGEDVGELCHSLVMLSHCRRQ